MSDVAVDPTIDSLAGCGASDCSGECSEGDEGRGVDVVVAGSVTEVMMT